MIPYPYARKAIIITERPPVKSFFDKKDEKAREKGSDVG